MPEIKTCPSAQALALFGQGKLSDAQAVTVAAHLETCADCRKAVASLPPGSFEGKVRAAQPRGTIIPPARSAPPPSIAGRPAAPSTPLANVPLEFVNHPKFRIIRELGRGGMGVIYLVEHRVMEKLVALKVISPAVLDNPQALARFHAEARAAGKLDHPNIARAFDADQAGNLHFLVMEFVEGQSLAQLLEQRGPLPVADACRYARQAAVGLQHAHEKGMVHRDIKPQNLMLTPQGLVKVLDFGLARLRSERKAAPRVTQLDSFMGTPEYVSPEQANDAREADTRADIYSLGCTLYALLAGRPPFAGTLVNVVMAHIEKEAQPLHELRPEVPPELEAVVAKMLAKDPAQRYQTPVEVAQALVGFVKAGAKLAAAGGVSVPPVASAGTGTRIGGDTSRVKGLGQGEVKRPAKAPAAEEEKGSPFSDLVDAPSAAPAPKKAKKERKEAKPTPAAWWKRPAVFAGAVGVALALILVAVVILNIKLQPSDPDRKAVGLISETSKAPPPTAEAAFVLEIDQPGVEVIVDGKKSDIVVPGDNKPIEIKMEPGQHKLQISKLGFETINKDIELTIGQSALIRLRLEPLKGVVAIEVDQPGAEVRVDGRKLSDNTPGDNKPLEIAMESGRYELRISKVGFEAEIRVVEVTVGKMVTIRVQLEPVKPVVVTRPADPVVDDPVYKSLVPGGFGARSSSELREKLLKDAGGSEASEAAVMLGLKWLALHQASDGHWSLDSFHEQAHEAVGSKTITCNCGGKGMILLDTNNIAATAFGLLPFLGAGITHQNDGQRKADYKKTVAAGLRWLLRAQQKDGDLDGSKNPMYAHALATIALCEAYGMSADPALKLPAQKAIDFIVQAQDPAAGGWRYTPRSGGDTDVSSWQVMALKSGQMAGLMVPKATLAGAEKWLDSVQTVNGSGYGYVGPYRGSGEIPTTTARGLLCRQYFGWKPPKPDLVNGVISLNKHTPGTSDQLNSIYFNNHATQVMYHMGGDSWSRWNPKMREQLIKTQDQGRTPKLQHQIGSWDPEGDVFGQQGGRIMQTSLSLLTLEVYYRHAPLHRGEFGAKEKGEE